MSDLTGLIERLEKEVRADIVEIAAALAAQNSPSADTFEQPFKEGAGVSEDTPTSALGGQQNSPSAVTRASTEDREASQDVSAALSGLSEEEVAEIWDHENETQRGTMTPWNLLGRGIQLFTLAFVQAATLRSASRRGEG